MEWSFIAIWIGLPTAAGYIAHKKGRSWIAAAGVTLLVSPLGILSVLLQSPHPSSGLPKNTRAKLLLGLFPLWASIIALVVGSFVSDSRDYWTVAPWMVLIAIPACAVTLGLVEVAGRRKRRDVKGTRDA